MGSRTVSWKQFGGSPERRHATMDTLALPLELSWEYDPSAGFSPFSVIAMDSVIFSGTLQGDIYLVHVATGKKISASDFGSAIAGVPALGNSMLFVPLATGQEGLVAHDLESGRSVWAGMTGPVETAPLLLDGRLVVATLAGEVVCFESGSGTRLWSFRLPDRGRPSFIRSSPSAGDSVVVFGADDGRVYGLSAHRGTLLWTVETGAAVSATPAVHADTAFVGSEDGTMYAIVLGTGEVAWRHQFDSPLYASAAIGEGNVFVGTSGGTVASLDRTSGAVAWIFRAQSVVSAAPLLAGEVLFFGSLDRTLYALDARTGSLLWSRTFESRIRTTPVLVHGRLIVQLENRTIVALTSAQSSR